MKKIILYLLLLYLVSTLFADDDQFNSYELEILKEFSFGDEFNGIGIQEIEEPSGPFGPGLFSSGTSFVINDEINKRFIYLTEDYEIDQINDYFTSWENMSISLGDMYIIGYTTHRIKIQNLSDNKITTIYSNIFPEIERYKSFFLFKDYLFIHTRNNELKSVALYNDVELQNIQKTREMLLANSEFSNIVVDKNSRLFYKSILKTRDYETFYRYWEEINGEVRSIKNAEFLVLKPEISLHSGTRYLGEDNDGNTYWNDGMGIWIFNLNGDCIDLFFPIPQIFYSTKPVILPSGDIYGLNYNYDSEKIELFKISRVW